MSGSSLSNSKNSSSSSQKGSSSFLDSKNEEEQEEKQRGSPCSNNGGLKAAKKLSAAKYRSILLKKQARVEEDEKSDKKKKKKLIEGLKVDLAQGVKGKLGNGSSRSMETEHIGGHCTENKLKGVERSKEGEIKAEDTVPVELEEMEGTLMSRFVEEQGESVKIVARLYSRGMRRKWQVMIMFVSSASLVEVLESSWDATARVAKRTVISNVLIRP